MGDTFRLEVEGYDEFVRAVRRASDTDLPKALGQMHKDIGRMIIDRLRPDSVGAGAGAIVRPSASKREVLLRVGGPHRENRAEQWGRREVWPGGRAPERPNIIGTAREHEAEIGERLLDTIDRVFKPPFE